MTPFERLVDEIAHAYADDPATVGAALTEHAAAVAHREHLDADDSPYAREVAAADADETREALLDVLRLPSEPTAPTYADRDGDRWVVTRQTTPEGELVLACPAPSDPDDAGDGPSHPWTLRTVRAMFGPLTQENPAA